MKNQSGNSWQEPYDVIQNFIFTSKIKPGEMITEVGMAEKLGIGRTPVREALHKLEQEGLIVTENRRKYVYLLTVKEIEEIFDIKIDLESSVCAWASERGTVEQKEQLKKILEEMRALFVIRPGVDESEEMWFKKWIEKDDELHQLIFKMAGNKRASNYLNNLNKQWHRLHIGLLAMEDRIEKSLAEHEMFVKAIIEGDSRNASENMKIHLLNLKRVLVQIFKIFNYPFD